MYKEYRKNINSVRKFHDELNVQKKQKNTFLNLHSLLKFSKIETHIFK
ncbi:hypothetical protein LEP1GSC079_4711 [Leptospira interrogans str. FPW1039]|uniref:Uncharacterized protein n=1 Tax=Leptospira interrogans str. FPW1039 TaxID=1193040 RepID=A0A0F6ID25_LEPIR|nr:hypothetical protein LEP1GSC096_0929 [Leptospira interrogans serovar Hebdomadis str. R499]EMJ35950.1 hypothetical protein LEP1GSC079_4711 [Leptospira interrogans str. FPW1039]EMN77646.1 hypothetical protein LEP1GSC102_4473 [Leptospira interrogans str. UI 09600]EMO00125.1 hypothetical protein LEP1GSC112_2879 [Leptospira interrogans serovar Pomona str. UT364]